MTGTRSKTRSEGEVHVLDFFFNDENCCALTVLIQDIRFHIITNPENLGSIGDDGGIAAQHESLISAIKAQAEEDKDAENPDSAYRPRTAPKANNGEDEVKHSKRSPSQESDSGLDVSDDLARDITAKPKVSTTTEVAQDPKKELHNWILQAFSEVFETLPSTTDTSDLQSLEEWYSGPTYFYDLCSDDGKLQCKQLESQGDLEKRIRNLKPGIVIPKYIKNMNIPWYKASDILVLSASDKQGPYRPCQVQAGEEIYFFKAVDNNQPQPTRREIKLMKEIERKGLHKKMRVPLVEGLVGYEDSKSEIMGFLQTNIEDPTPLTTMLDSDVIEEKREKWAWETQRMVQLLHDNDIVWGDAKADNFMVDRYGDLWIIDFGGSYTDGWVDPELMETEEGDDMGVEKIVNALEDPEANTYDPAEVEGREEELVANKRSKTCDQDEQDDDGRSSSAKRRKLA
ncbi:putative Protein kinase domain-containing protein [Seiridium cardinale]